MPFLNCLSPSPRGAPYSSSMEQTLTDAIVTFMLLSPRSRSLDFDTSAKELAVPLDEGRAFTAFRVNFHGKDVAVE